MGKDYVQGQRLKVRTKISTYEGLMMQRPLMAGSSHITLKLDSGYNVGILKASILDVEAGDVVSAEPVPPSENVPNDPGKPGVSILATGGTIASRVDYLTGGVYSAFTAEDLISAVPEMADVANVRGRQLFNKFSENMAPADWVVMAEQVHAEIREGVDGVVVTHGTDTMGYSAAALSFMLKPSVPVVFTGAQRSSDRGSSDAASNLLKSVGFSSSADLSGVCVLMHEASGDDSFLVHAGVNVRKMHSSRRDAFKSVNSQPIARIDGGGTEFIRSSWDARGGKLEKDTRIQEKVVLLKYHPGFAKGVVTYFIDEGFKGIVLEGTGLGHTSDVLFDEIEQAISSGMTVAMTSQTLYGRTNMNVYSTGRRLLEMGVIPCAAMLPETAYVKLCCVLGRVSKQDEVRELMLTDLAGELADNSLA
ncbi:Glu-tRNA(Gln) amidotransferase subunit GatD [Candidatus Altiarchaeota archaeon]